MTPLVLLPGLMCDARLFAPQVARFSQERAVMVSALTGHEDTPSLASAVLAAAPPTFALCGLSMGGIVAMEVIRQAPERVERLALLDTNPLAEADAVAQMRNRHIEQVRVGQLAAVMRDELKPKYLADGPNRREILDLCLSMALALGDDVFVQQSRALQSRPDQSETLKRVSVPTLVLCGQEDALCPIERHELMQDLVPGSTLSVIPGAGHLPTLEQPDQTNGTLATWLSA